MKKQVLIGLALSLMFGSSTTAQEGPSYGDTVNFLREKLNTVRRPGGDNCTGCGYGSDSEFTEIAHCRFSYTITVKQHGYHDDLQRQIFSASDIDPSRISTRHANYVTAEVRRNESKVELWERRGTPLSQNAGQFGLIDRTPMIGFYQVLSPADDTNRRITSALGHLVEICGGEEELF